MNPPVVVNNDLVSHHEKQKGGRVKNILEAM